MLWKKVMSGLSAGRVQSVATRLVVERERERMAFRVASYWDLEGTFDAGASKEPRMFPAKLHSIDGARVAAALRDGARRGGVARARGTRPERLARRLRGDLDTIVLTAMEKDPARRYQSSGEMMQHCQQVFAELNQGGASIGAGGGSIVTMSSGAGAFPHRYLWAYGAAKAGIDMLSRSAAEELGAAGIRVNSVQPGIVDDDLMSPITAGGPLLDDYIEGMPLGRVGQVDDIAEAVRFLAGPESSWITGVNLPIDGGHHLRAGANYSLLFG